MSGMSPPAQRHPARRGSILIQLLLAMILCSALVMLMLPLFQLLLRQDFLMRSTQDEIQLRQLRQVLMRSEQITVHPHALSFVLDQQERELCQSGQWLLIRPGTWILFDEVEEVSFHQEGNCIVMTLQTRHGEVRREIGWIE